MSEPNPLKKTQANRSPHDPRSPHESVSSLRGVREAEIDPENDIEFTWSTYGVVVVAGVVGAFIVAVTLLAIDLMMGRPALWTPAVLGSALFLGEAVADQPDFRPTNMMPVVFGYTLVHGVAFIGFASAASAGRLTVFNRSPMTLNQGAVTATVIFFGLQIFFVSMGMLVGSEVDLVQRLGFGSVALANALAAIGMTYTVGMLARRLHPRGELVS